MPMRNRFKVSVTKYFGKNVGNKAKISQIFHAKSFSESK